MILVNHTQVDMPKNLADGTWSDEVSVREIQGIVVALITPDGVTYHQYGKTSENGLPVDENTIFEIASITKTFTSILLADMAQDGTVTLKDPVRRHLPDGVAMPGGDAIVLEHLATQRSGLPGIPDSIDILNPNPYEKFTAHDLYTFLSSYLLTRKPDTEYEYSNLGFGLLGHVLSLASGKPFEELVRERICEPLGMKDTVITLSEEQRSRFAKGHSSTGKVVSYWDFDCLEGCGALKSTAADLAVYIQANLGLLPSGLLSSMVLTHAPRAESGIQNWRIGLGWNLLALPDGDMIWHNGISGGFHNFCGFIPSRKIGVVVVSNSRYDIEGLGLHILEPAVPLGEVKKMIPVAETILLRYVGTYRMKQGVDYVVTMEDGTLSVMITEQTPLVVLPSSETSFFYVDVEAQITFTEDSNGKVTGLIMSQGGVDRLAQKISE